MKRIIRPMFFVLLAFTLPVSVAMGQDNKKEKKIKVIIEEGSGSETILDTIIAGTEDIEKIEVKDGTIVFIGSQDMKQVRMADSKKVIVSIETDGEGEKQTEKSIYITAGDTPAWTVSTDGEKEHIYVISSDKSKDGKPQKHIIVSSSGDKSGDWVSSDSDMTKYVVAKDGIVVTVESDDEEKAQEIIKLIQDKLEVKSEGKK